MNVSLAPLAILLIVFLVGDGVAGAIPIKYIKDDLARLNVPDQIQRLVPVCKFAAAAGLIVGLWVPVIGLLTCGALIAYFVVAFGYHQRAHDPVAKYAAAIAVSAFIVVTAVLSYLPGL